MNSRGSFSSRERDRSSMVSISSFARHPADIGRQGEVSDGRHIRFGGTFGGMGDE